MNTTSRLDLTNEQTTCERIGHIWWEGGICDRCGEEKGRRCRQAETTRDCSRNHNWFDGRAYHK